MQPEYVGRHNVTTGPFIGQKLAGPTMQFTLKGMTGRYAFVDNRLTWIPG